MNAAVRSDHEIFDLVGLSVSRTDDAVGSSDSIAYDVNNHGEVVGYMPSGAGYHAFLYSGRALTDIGTRGGAGSFAYSLNDSGTVVGDYALEDGIHAFMYANGSMTALSIAGYSEATAINSAGIITGTGSYLDSEGFCQPHVYTYTNGVVTDLGGLPNGYGTHGNGINDHGHLAVRPQTGSMNSSRSRDPHVGQGSVTQSGSISRRRCRSLVQAHCLAPVSCCWWATQNEGTSVYPYDSGDTHWAMLRKT